MNNNSINSTSELPVIHMTTKSLVLLLEHIKDAGNWNNTPQVNVDNRTRGNLCHLKRLGLVRTWDYNDDQFMSFTFTDGQVVTDGGAKFKLWYSSKPEDTCGNDKLPLYTQVG